MPRICNICESEQLEEMGSIGGKMWYRCENCNMDVEGLITDDN